MKLKGGSLNLSAKILKAVDETMIHGEHSMLFCVAA